MTTIHRDNDERLLRKANRIFDKARSFYESHKYEEALPFYKKSLRLRESILGRYGHLDVAKSYSAIGQTYFRLEKYDMSIVPYYTSLRIRLYLSAATGDNNNNNTTTHEKEDGSSRSTTPPNNNDVYDTPKSELKHNRQSLEKILGFTQKDLEDYENQMEKSIELELEGDEYRELGQYETAIGIYKRVLMLLPNHSPPTSSSSSASSSMMLKKNHHDPTATFLLRKIAICSCGQDTLDHRTVDWMVVDRINHTNFSSQFVDEKGLFPVEVIERIEKGDVFYVAGKGQEAMEEYQRATELGKEYVSRHRMMKSMSRLIETNNMWMLKALTEVSTISQQDSIVRLQDLDTKLENVTRRVNTMSRKIRTIQSFPDETAKVVAVQLEGSMASLETGLVYKLDQVTKQLDAFDRKFSNPEGAITTTDAAAAAETRSGKEQQHQPDVSMRLQLKSSAKSWDEHESGSITDNSWEDVDQLFVVEEDQLFDEGEDDDEFKKPEETKVQDTVRMVEDDRSSSPLLLKKLIKEKELKNPEEAKMRDTVPMGKDAHSSSPLLLNALVTQSLERMNPDLQQQMALKMEELHVKLSEEIQTSMLRVLQQTVTNGNTTEVTAAMVTKNETKNDLESPHHEEQVLAIQIEGGTKVQPDDLQAMWSDHAIAMRRDARSQSKKLKAKLKQEIATQTQTMGVELQKKLDHVLKPKSNCCQHRHHRPEGFSGCDNSGSNGDGSFVVEDSGFEKRQDNRGDGMNFKIPISLVSYGICCFFASFLVILMNGIRYVTNQSSFPMKPSPNDTREENASSSDSLQSPSTFEESSSTSSQNKIEQLLETCRSSICEAMDRIQKLVEDGNTEDAFGEIHNVGQVITAFTNQLRQGMTESVSSATEYCCFEEDLHLD